MNVIGFVRRHAPTILSWLAAGGVVGTACLSSRAGMKSAKILEDARKETGEEMTMLEKAKRIAPAYISTALVGGGTIACILGSDHMNRKRQAMLIGAYATVSKMLESYREKTKAIMGPKADETIVKAIEDEQRDISEDRPPWNEKQEFLLDFDDLHHAIRFEATMEEVLEAEYLVNRLLVLKYQATLNEFLKLLDLEPVEGGDDIGWDDYIGETTYGYRWIDFRNNQTIDEDGKLVCWIEMPFEPHPLDEKENDSWLDDKLSQIQGVLQE